MKKVLFTATVDSHIIHFHLPYLKLFKGKGYEVHVISCGENKIPYCDVKYNVQMNKKPLSLTNIKAYRIIKEIINSNKYDIIHTHTPICGVLTRLAARKTRKLGTKVIYTAHGFHFYKGSHLFRWIIYYPIEKIMSNFTDVLITINKEDYKISEKFKSKEKVYIPGVGVDTDKYKPISKNEKKELRIKNGFFEDDFIITYVAELSKRKNQDMAIKCMSILKDKIENIKLILVGDGDLEKYYKNKVQKSNLDEYIFFLGYRNDINEIYEMSDIAISTSKQEGLPMNMMEAMSCGMPVVATNCRGNRDLVTDGVNGYLVNIGDYHMFANKIIELRDNINLRDEIIHNNIDEIKKYNVEIITNKYENVYFVAGE